MEYSDFWKRVNLLIKSQNKTQSSLSLECGFSERRINSLSASSRSPDINEAVKIANCLNVTVEYLVTGEESDNHETIKKIEADLRDAQLQLSLL